MGRLTEKDEQGNWYLKGLPWKCLHSGETITTAVREKLYGTLCKLKDYEDTGLSPADVERLNDFERSQVEILLKQLCEERKKHSWIPAEEPPKTEYYVLLSFSNSPLLAIGRYEENEDGDGAYYLGDDEETCISNSLMVNAWMLLPKPYQSEED